MVHGVNYSSLMVLKNHDMEDVVGLFVDAEPVAMMESLDNWVLFLGLDKVGVRGKLHRTI